LIALGAVGAAAEQTAHPVGFRIFGLLRDQPFVLLFLVVAVGYALGRISVKHISLGATASTLLLSLAVSLVGSAVYATTFQVPDFVGSVFFNLYMFAIGMKIGPQFISGLKSDARNYIILGVLTPVLAIVIALGLALLYRFPPGVAAGILGGADTATPGLGAAKDAIMSGKAHLPAGVTPDEVIGQMSTTFAFAYCISTALFVVMLKLLPQLFGRNAVEDAKAFERKAQGGGDVPLPGAAETFLRRPVPTAVRVYRVEAPETDGRTVKELHQRYPLAVIERIKHEGLIADATDEQVVHLGDKVALSGRVERHLQNYRKVGPEVADPELADVGFETVELIIRKRAVVGQTLEQVAASWGHGLYLNALFRGGEAIPYGPATKIQKDDVLRVTGGALHLKRLAEQAGTVVQPSLSTDIVTIALGVSLGALLGALSIRLGDVKLSLGSAVGLLIVGIALSILRTRNPSIGGPFPEPARRLIEDLGLNVFAAVLGLNAGANVLAAMQRGSLLPIIVGVLLIGLLPPLLAWLLGQYRFRMNSALLLGAVAGARCNSPGMRAAQEATRSTVPAVSYPVTFALSNIALTLACYFFGIFF
jgi:putative transport protein